MTPQQDRAAPPPECEHPALMAYTTVDGSSRLWACVTCRRRFYPACPVCVVVGHRGVDHPAGFLLGSTMHSGGNGG